MVHLSHLFSSLLKKITFVGKFHLKSGHDLEKSHQTLQSLLGNVGKQRQPHPWVLQLQLGHGHTQRKDGLE